MSTITTKDATELYYRDWGTRQPLFSVTALTGDAFEYEMQARHIVPVDTPTSVTDHGCVPLPITFAMIRALQKTDPRCNNATSPGGAEALRQEPLKPSR